MIIMKKSKKKESWSCSSIFILLMITFAVIGSFDPESESESESETRTKKSQTHSKADLEKQIANTAETDLIESLSNKRFKENLQRKMGKNLLQIACITNKAELARRLMENEFSINEFSINELDKKGNTPIMLALSNNSGECVQFLAKKSPDLTVKNRSGMLAIHPAAKFGFFDVVKESIRQGVNVDSTAPGGYTALHFAARAGHLDIVVLLCENGANPSATMGYGWTPGDLAFKEHKDVSLYLQSRNGALSVAQLTREFSLSNGWPLPGLKEIENSTEGAEKKLFIAALSDDTTALRNFAANNRNFDAKSNAKTPLLCFALIHKKFAAAKIILENVKEIDATDASGRTALLHAVISGNEEFALDILEKSADPNIKDLTGNVALLAAVRGWHNKLVPALIRSGAEVFAQNRLEQGPLHFAIESFNVQMIEFLVKNGCDVNKEDIHGNTPLHIAAKFGNTPLVAKLLKNGASPFAMNLKNKNPIDMVPQGNKEIVKLLSNRSEIEGINPSEKAPAEVDLTLPPVANPAAEETP